MDALAWEIARRGALATLERARARVIRSGVQAEIKIVQGRAARQIVAVVGNLDRVGRGSVTVHWDGRLQSSNVVPRSPGHHEVRVTIRPDARSRPLGVEGG